MAAWFIRVIGKPKKEFDVNVVAQAVIALARRLSEQEHGKRDPLRQENTT